VLQKSFCAGDQNFCGPQARLSCKDARDLIASRETHSLARLGGNATGFTQFEYGLSGKWAELVKEIVPGLKRIGVLWHSGNPAGLEVGSHGAGTPV